MDSEDELNSLKIKNERLLMLRRWAKRKGKDSMKDGVKKFKANPKGPIQVDSDSNEPTNPNAKFSNDISDSEPEASGSNDSNKTESSDDNTDIENEKEESDQKNEKQSLEKKESSESSTLEKKSSEKINTEPSNPSYMNERQFIKEKFLVEMPEDFYQFWDFCKTLKPEKPEDAFSQIGLKLVGPFDVLAGKFKDCTKTDEEYLIHWRYFKDPPEFQTVLKGNNKTGYHIGYFRDSPEEMPVFLCNNSSEKDGILTTMGENIFAAVCFYCEDSKVRGDIFTRVHVGKMHLLVKEEASKLKLDLSKKTNRMVQREKKMVTRSVNKVGLVVPYDRKTQLGYREMAIDKAELLKLLTKIQNASGDERKKYLSEIQSLFTFANIATDECDFGTGIEVGWTLMYHGVDCLNSTISDFLTTNYGLLNREAFAKIAKAHMNNRRKGSNLSIL